MRISRGVLLHRAGNIHVQSTWTYSRFMWKFSSFEVKKSINNIFIHWHTPRNWQWVPDKHKRDDFNFPVVDFPYMCRNIWSALEILEHVIHNRVSFINGCCYKETYPINSPYVEVITTKGLRSPSCLDWSLRNICKTDDQG